MGPSVVVYDIEIEKAVPQAGKPAVEGVAYCAGWHDHANMGISVIGAYDYLEERYRVFCADNVYEFTALVTRPDTLLVGFNNIAFDNAVIAATPPWLLPAAGIYYDLLREIWAAAGFGPTFDASTHAGYGLDQMAAANLGARKSGHGALAPIDWQKGRIASVIDYCLNDVWLTKRLFDKILRGESLVNHKAIGPLILRAPLNPVAAAQEVPE